MKFKASSGTTKNYIQSKEDHMQHNGILAVLTIFSLVGVVTSGYAFFVHDIPLALSLSTLAGCLGVGVVWYVILDKNPHIQFVETWRYGVAALLAVSWLLLTHLTTYTVVIIDEPIFAPEGRTETRNWLPWPVKAAVMCALVFGPWLCRRTWARVRNTMSEKSLSQQR